MTSLVRSRPFRWVFVFLGTLLVLYGSLGLLLNLHLMERFAEGLSSWRAAVLGGQWGASPVSFSDLPPWLEALRAHYDRAVLLAWLAWGAGLVLLWLAAGRRPGARQLTRPHWDWRDLAALLLLAVVLAVGGVLRARFLLPGGVGALPASHYDEMVYLEAALLWVRGLRPYGDFFLAHPPGVLIALAPAVAFAQRWGGLNLLLAGRWLQCLYGLGTVALLYLLGRRVGGRRAGLLAALVLAVDVQAVQVAPLETVANLSTAGALALYLAGLSTARRGRRLLLVGLAGASAAFSAATKAPAGVALIVLFLLALLAWQWRDLLAGAAGAASAVLPLGWFFARPALGAFWRQVLAFQVLRPQETTYARNHLVRMADYPESRLTFLLLIGAVLLLSAVALADSWRAAAGRNACRPTGPGAWLVPPLVVGIVLWLLLFSYGRAYHSRYYVQLILPLALLVAAAGGEVAPRWVRCPAWGRAMAGLGAVLGLALLLPQLTLQRAAAEGVVYDRSYQVVSAALREGVPPDTPVLALDPGYVLLANRPPAFLPDGTRLVDGAGLMVYRALEIAGRSAGDVLAAARESVREIAPWTVFHRPAAQDLVVSALYGGRPERSSAAVVIDMRIAAEDLTPQTQEFLRARGPRLAWEQYTEAIVVERRAFLAQSVSGLGLVDFNMRALSPQGEGPAAPQGETLEIPSGEVLQVSLYWYVEDVPSLPLRVGLELRDSAAKTVARLVEPPHFGDPPATSWQAGWVYGDHHNLPLSAEVPHGEYALCVAILEVSSPRALPWSVGTSEDGVLCIGRVRVGR